MTSGRGRTTITTRGPETDVVAELRSRFSAIGTTEPSDVIVVDLRHDPDGSDAVSLVVEQFVTAMASRATRVVVAFANHDGVPAHDADDVHRTGPGTLDDALAADQLLEVWRLSCTGDTAGPLVFEHPAAIARFVLERLTAFGRVVDPPVSLGAPALVIGSLAPGLMDALEQLAVLRGIVVSLSGNDLDHAEALRRGNDVVDECVAAVTANVVGALERLAFVDTTTGLPNRAALRYKLPDMAARARLRRACITVALLELDRLDPVGGPARPEDDSRVLRVLTSEWNAKLGTAHELFHVGGSQFVLVMPDLSRAMATELVRRTVQHPSLRCAWGIAELPADADDVEELISAADRRLRAHVARLRPLAP